MVLRSSERSSSPFEGNIPLGLDGILIFAKLASKTLPRLESSLSTTFSPTDDRSLGLLKVCFHDHQITSYSSIIQNPLIAD